MKRSVVVIAVGVTVAIFISMYYVIGVAGPSSLLPPPSDSVSEDSFTYSDIEKIQNTLAEQKIVVSAPTPITDHTIDRYCTFFENDRLKTVEYCTTTLVSGSQGGALGNINIGGSAESPVMAVANLETSSIESDQINSDVFTVFETMIETLVCECWEEKESKDYESIFSWLDAVQTFYLDSDKRNIKSTVDDLNGHKIILEITSGDDNNSILQTLIILK